MRELERVFRMSDCCCRIAWSRSPSIPLLTFWPAEARIDGGGGTAADAHFFLALCSRGPLPEPKSFVYVPKAANMLRERELHVEALERQLADIKADRQALLELFRQQTRELEERNQWAQRLDMDLKTAGERIVALQTEAAELAAGYQAQMTRMEERGSGEDRMGAQSFGGTGSEVPGTGRIASDCWMPPKQRCANEPIWAQTAEAQRGGTGGAA